MLHADVSGQGPRLVLVHGFTQTGRSWGPFGDLVSSGREAVRVDLPGHGGSATLRADVRDSAGLVSEVARAGSGTYDLLGYSLGARVALHVALFHPEGLRRLVLIGATAGMEDPERRAERVARDGALADHAESDTEGFLAHWVAQPMFSGVRDAGMDERRRNDGAGLASSLRLAGTGTQEPLWERLGEIASPVLAVAGMNDVRFASAAARIARSVPDGVASLVPGAGHATHLEQPALCARIVIRFLDASARDG